MTAAPNTQPIVFSFTQPSKPVSINELGRSWGKKKRLLDPWKIAANKAAVDYMESHPLAYPIRHYTVQFTFGFLKNARRDAHNFMAATGKQVLDAIVLAGLIDDDRSEWCEVIDPILFVGTNLCTVTIRSLNESEAA